MYEVHNLSLLTKYQNSHPFSGDTPGDYKDLKPNNPNVKVEDGALNIANIQKTNEGYYLCEAVNGIGSGLSAVILISVQGKLNLDRHYHIIEYLGKKLHFEFFVAPPQFEIKMRNQTARRSEPAVLQCQAKGEKVKPLFLICE